MEKKIEPELTHCFDSFEQHQKGVDHGSIKKEKNRD